jgi:hypothetical protein
VIPGQDSTDRQPSQGLSGRFVSLGDASPTAPATHLNKPLRKEIGRVRLALLAVGLLSVLGSGCNGVVLAGLLLAGPPTIEPDYDKMTKKSLRDKGVKVAVVCFAPDEVRLNFIDVDKDIAKYCAHQFNQHHIPVINPDRIQEWLDKHEDWDKPEEIGEATKATHIILVDVHKYNLFEENTHELYKGRAELLISVFEMQKDGSTEKVYTKEITCQYPLETPRETSEISYDRFRREYLARLSEEVGRLFYSHENGDDMRDVI